MANTRDDPRIRDGFASPEDLYDWARRDKDGRDMPDGMLRQMAAIAFHDYEKTYPSKAQLEAQCVKAAALARKLTRKMTDEDVASWIALQWRKASDPNFNDITVVNSDDKGAHNRVRKQNGILPVMVNDMAEPERIICHHRYGKSQLPNGQIVLQPVADAYVAVIIERRDRGELVREARRLALAEQAAAEAAAPAPAPAPAPLETQADRAAARARAFRALWRKAIRMVIRQNRADALANVDNAAAAEAQRKVREAADAANAAKQPRAYTASGPSHKTGAAQWAEEPADAAEKAKEEVRRDTSKEAQAKAIADKKRAEEEATAHRLWQLEQIRKGEEIGGSK